MMDMKNSPLATLNDAGLLKTDALIGADWVAGSARFAVSDPATGQTLAQVANLDGAGAEELWRRELGLRPVAREAALA